MNKKLLAVAIGAALAAPMYAANAAVTVGGQAHISADYVDTFAVTTGTTLNANSTKQWNISSNVSNIFFKAEEDLGGGLKGVFFLQEYFRLDNNSGSVASSTTGSNRMHDAPAYAGLSGGFGSILLGNMDSPTKLVGRAVDLFNNQIGDSRNAAADNTRMQNSVFYATPNFGGVVVTLAHSTNLDNTISATSADTTVNTGAPPLSATATAVTGSKTGNALGVKFESGPVLVGAAYQYVINNDATTGPAVYDDNVIWNVGAAFKIGTAARIVAFYQDASANGNVIGTDAATYGLGGSFTFGNETIKAQYYNVTKSVLAKTDVSSSVYAIGYDHAFSKTFTGYVAYAAASNDATTATSAAGNTVGSDGGGGHGDTPNVFGGADQTGLSLGIIYNF